MPMLACHRCGDPFHGRPNRRYCSTRCRRIMEAKRHRWDMLAARIERLEAEASSAEPEARATLSRQVERLRYRLGDTARP